MKQKLLLKTMLLLCVLVGGVSNAWATENDVHDMSISQSTQLNNSATIPSININQQSYPIKKVTINYRHNKNIDDPVTIEVIVGGNSWGSKNITKNTTADIDFEGSSTIGAVTINFTNNSGSGTGKGTLWINSVKLTEGAVAVAGTTAAPSIKGDTPFINSTTVTITNVASADGADIYYTLNGDAPTTTTSATCFAYSAPFTVDATTTVKAIAKKSTDTNASSVVNKTFTKVTPMTVSEALTAISALEKDDTIDDQCVSGIVCTAGSLNNGTITYYISADGTAAHRLQVYKGKGLYNADFENDADIAVGDEVVVYGTLKNYNGTTPEFDQGSYLLSKVTSPTLSADPATATAFTYTVGNGPSEDQMFTITGTNLVSADITATVSSDYEITDNTDYSSSVTIASGDIVSVRLKSGLAKGTHNGTLTLSSTDATNVVINLSGTVTGQTYAIEQYTAPATAHGTITFSPASPIEDGTEVTLSAEPAEGYTFTANSWVIYKQSGEDYVVDNSVTVTANKFTMPAYAIWVDGTFAAKPTYAITCVASPVAGGTIVSDGNAYEGKTVTISCEAASGYELTGIVITKTSDGSATGITPAKSGDDYTFTMPGYAVTATATFLSNTYEGTFALYSGDLTEGDYILVYDGKALKNTVSSNKFGIQSVTPSNNTITDPLRSIVWHIAPSATDGYWTIYNAKADLYANGTEKSTNVSLGDDPTANTAIWAVSGTYDFRCKDNEGQSTARYLRYYDSSEVFGNYASSNGGALTLYKYTTLTPRTITFNGNGGTYNETTTYTQDVYDGVEATLNANKFTRNGYEFIAWNNQADGNGATSCDDGDKITVTGSDLTLYALWAPLYTLTIDNNIDGGSVAVEGNVTSSVEGVEITLSYNPTAGHKFSAWNVYKEGDTSTKVTVTDNKFAMPNYNVVISATFEEVQTYSLVTDVNDIVPGKHYIIASGTNGSVKAIGAQSTNNRTAVSVTATSGIIPETDGVYEFVIYGPDADGYYTIYDETNTKYLYAASSSSNYLKTQGTNDAEGKWNISIANSGSATVKAQGSNTRNWMRNNGDIFSCYGSGQSDIYLYVKDGDTPVATTASVKLNAYGYATFASTSALDFLDADADGVEYSAWQITGVTNNEIAFSQITSSIAAGKGILLKGTPNATINLNILPVGGAALSSNKLTGITTATAIEADTYYGLSGNKFVKVNAGTVKAGKALLPASEIPTTARELKFVFEDETTAIRGIENGQLRMENSFFDLQGRKVAKPTKGLYIKNGKKVFMK